MHQSIVDLSCLFVLPEGSQCFFPIKMVLTQQACLKSVVQKTLDLQTKNMSYSRRPIDVSKDVRHVHKTSLSLISSDRCLHWASIGREDVYETSHARLDMTFMRHDTKTSFSFANSRTFVRGSVIFSLKLNKANVPSVPF